MKAEIKKLIDSRIAAGKSYAQIHAILKTLDHAADNKAADALLKEAKVEKTVKKASIIDSMYEFIAESRRSEKDLETWIKANGTDNTLRWIKQHDKARVLVNRLHDKLNVEKAGGPVQEPK